MDDTFIAAVRAELATLKRRSAALCAMLAAYDIAEEASVESATQAKPEKPTAPLTGLIPPRDRVRTDRFSSYGESVVDAAEAALTGREDAPVPTRELVGMIEERGVEIRGNDKVNALSALLSRSTRIKSNGRRGWTLNKGYGVIPPNENGTAEAVPDAEEAPTSSNDSRDDVFASLG